MKWCTTGRWKQKSSEGVAWDPSDATRWKETWSHHNRQTTWDTHFARWFVDRKGCVEKLKDSLPEEVSASRLLQRIGMLVAHIKSEMKRAHVAHTQLRNSDPLPDGAIETEGRGSLDLRRDSKNIVQRYGQPQGHHNEYPRTSTFFVAEWESRAFGESWQLDGTRSEGSQHSKRSGSAAAASAVCAKMVAAVVCGSPFTTGTRGSHRAGISFR